MHGGIAGNNRRFRYMLGNSNLLIGADEQVATTDFNIRFLRPCLTDATCKARVIKIGNRLCVAEADLLDEQGRKVAVAQATYARI